jgi:periplasmic divalent cation tolerance protein
MHRSEGPVNPAVVLVLTTEGSRQRATRLASELVERRLAACVSMVDMRSVYRWRGEAQTETEVQLVIKTTRASLARLVEAIHELHGYELPEVAVLDADAGSSYAAWVAAEVD